MTKLVIITGPTASGKTSFAEKLALEFKGEIVSADSRQIYKEMDVGTNKEEISVPQHLIDIISPDEEFTLQNYKNLAVKTINGISERGKTPFLVGGTPLYIYAVVDNWQIPKVPANKALRAKLEKEDVESLYQKLKTLDVASSEMTGKNKRRVIRALEVIMTTGKPFSSQRKKGRQIFNTLILGLQPDKKTLENKIKERTEEMIERGLQEEVAALQEKYGWDSPAMSGIHYKEWRPYFEGKISKKETIKEINKNNRAYTRRQFQWLKKDPRVKWVPNYQEAEKLIKKFLNQNNTW